MKERPILFSAPMVRALLAGAKTQTRRAVKLRDRLGLFDLDGYNSVTTDTIIKVSWTSQSIQKLVPCPYGQPGDRLWVRESFEDCESALHSCVIYRADGGDCGVKWSPSIHMPRWASRIALEVTGVRVERLQDISNDDAMAEGMAWDDAVFDYRTLWEKLNGAGSWDSNPWVWVVEFKRIGASA